MIPPPPAGCDWRRCLIVAPGPSLAAEDVALFRGRVPAIAVGDAWRLAPWAAALYHADAPWWKQHDGCGEYAGLKLVAAKTVSDKTDPAWGLIPLRTERRPGFSFDPAFVHEGTNSGFQALNLAILWGAREIYLLGYDMGRTGGKAHFFGDHPAAIRKPSPFDKFRAAFEAAAPSLPAAGVRVVNCSRETALECFERGAADAVLADLAA